MDKMSQATKILDARRRLLSGLSTERRAPIAAEGGCGVLGLACNVPLAGRHVIPASRQMHNRGNGKGGGIAASGLDAAQMGVTPEVLRSHYLLQIAYLDPAARPEVEAECLLPHFDLAQGYRVPTLDDYRQVEELEMRPPDVWRYFARVKPGVLERFATAHGLAELPARAIEDEFVYQNSFRLNQRFYASLGGAQGQRAFVLSHGRDLLVLKIVGYAEQAAQYYCLDDVTAHVWIAHQRYPTKGRVWHPGGAHPFVGLNEALVHNGDFANYHAVAEYLRQRNITPLFLTDTEVSALLFDLWDRVYGYPLEVTLEALAPTTERDFDVLPPDKQRLYRAIQATHIHASPDGPWFFIIARSQPDHNQWQLLGITDTSMLRPQVFALYEAQNSQLGAGPETVQLGLVASERQAIQAALRSLADEDTRFLPHADRYWVARGGSHTDGGAFVFTVSQENEAQGDAGCRLTCADKFGQPVTVAPEQNHLDRSRLTPERAGAAFRQTVQDKIYTAFDNGGAPTLFRWASGAMHGWDYDQSAAFVETVAHFGQAGGDEWTFSRHGLTLLRDRRYDPGAKRRASLLTLLDEGLASLFAAVSPITQSTNPQSTNSQPAQLLITHATHRALRSPASHETTLLIDALGFPPEGDHSAARLLVSAHQLGWQRFIVYNWRGGRFAACGLGPDTTGVQIDIYGNAGDYLGSGLDGAEVHVHGDAQDQVGQILKSGSLVIHGDVGQTFLYGAKGGEIYVMGSAAGRPLINAVGRPRAVINGTCLDYLAESFMAGDPLHGGGFVILNGVTFDERGRLVELDTPYPGGNLFSLASGGAIYLRDPHREVTPDQLNGGQFAPLSSADWALIQPYLARNERIFGISVDTLLTVDGEQCDPRQVYRKVEVQGP
jgi:glutamate synthase domain-containing protein 3